MCVRVREKNKKQTNKKKKKKKKNERLMKERKAELNFGNHAVKSFFLFICLFVCLFVCLFIYLFIYVFTYFVYASPFREIIIQVYR